MFWRRGTARLWDNPVKYFTVKKFASLAIISQNPGFIEIQVLELVYTQYFIRELFNLALVSIPGTGIVYWYTVMWYLVSIPKFENPF